jgi:hypothetical protein
MLRVLRDADGGRGIVRGLFQGGACGRLVVTLGLPGPRSSDHKLHVKGLGYAQLVHSRSCVRE